MFLKGRIEEITFLKGFLILIACAVCYALTVVIAGWFIFIIGPAGALTALAGGLVFMTARAVETKNIGRWLAIVGGVLVSGPAFYLLGWAIGR